MYQLPVHMYRLLVATTTFSVAFDLEHYLRQHGNN